MSITVENLVVERGGKKVLHGISFTLAAGRISTLLGANGVRDVRTQSAFGLSAVVVEFDWGTDMRVDRQVVQERLTTVAGDLPPALRPQMAPPGAIMGQVILAGMRRRAGPTGGELAAVPGTSFYAERVTAADGAVSLKVWQPTDRHDLSAWKPVKVAVYDTAALPGAVRRWTATAGPVTVRSSRRIRKGANAPVSRLSETRSPSRSNRMYLSSVPPWYAQLEARERFCVVDVLYVMKLTGMHVAPLAALEKAFTSASV